jgi:hypothetical protein
LPAWSIAFTNCHRVFDPSLFMQATIDRGRTLGRKYTLVVFVTLAAGFIFMTTLQIVFAVFGVGAAPLATAGEPGVIVSGSCEAELRTMTAAVERAILASATAPDEDRAAAGYDAALAPEWNEGRGVEARCAATERGVDAYATVLRFRAVGKELARRHARELGPLRKDLAVYLPPDGLPR